MTGTLVSLKSEQGAGEAAAGVVAVPARAASPAMPHCRRDWGPGPDLRRQRRRKTSEKQEKPADTPGGRRPGRPIAWSLRAAEQAPGIRSVLKMETLQAESVFMRRVTL